MFYGETMPLIDITFPELNNHVWSETWDHNEKLEVLENQCTAYLEQNLPANERALARKSHHFWYNFTLQPHKNRSVGKVNSENARFSMEFRRDSYVLVTPLEPKEEHPPKEDHPIDPEITVAELLKLLEENKYLPAKCCYDIMDSKGRVLEPNNTLFEEKVHPYRDPKKNQDSHLIVRLKSDLHKRVILTIVASLLLGILFGYLLHKLILR